MSCTLHASRPLAQRRAFPARALRALCVVLFFGLPLLGCGSEAEESREVMGASPLLDGAGGAPSTGLWFPDIVPCPDGMLRAEDGSGHCIPILPPGGGVEGPGDELPHVIGGRLPSDEVLGSGEAHGVPWVEGYHGDSGLHWVDVGGTLADYQDMDAPRDAVRLRDVELGEAHVALGFASEDASRAGTAWVRADEVQWDVHDGTQGFTLRYGLDAQVVTRGEGAVELHAPVMQDFSVEHEGEHFVTRRWEHALDRYIPEQEGLRFEHLIGALPEGHEGDYGVRERVVLDEEMELLVEFEGLAIGAVRESRDAILISRAGDRETSVLAFAAPRSWDADGVPALDQEAGRSIGNLTRYEVRRLDEQEWEITTWLDGTWLREEERTWPVTLDPTARWLDAGVTAYLEGRWNEPFNQCVSRSRTQYWLSPSTMGGIINPGAVVAGASFYQNQTHNDLSNNINRIIRNRAYLYLRNATAIPPLTHTALANFSPDWGHPLWFGESGKEYGTTSCFVFGTCRRMRPGWWGQYDSHTIRGPASGHGDFIYDGNFLQVTAGHEDGQDISPNWFSGIFIDRCSAYSNFQFSFCPDGTACEIFSSVIEGPIGQGFGWRSFPRTRLWFTPAQDLTSAPGYRREARLGSNAPPELQQNEAGEVPSLGGVHTWTFTVPPAGGDVSVITESQDTSDIRLWVYDTDGNRLCTEVDGMQCPERRTFQARNAIKRTEDGQQNEGGVTQDVCPQDQVLVGFRGNRDIMDGFFGIVGYYFTRSLQPICAQVHIDRDGHGSYRIQPVGMLPRRGGGGSTSEYLCPDGQVISGIRVRRRGTSSAGIHNFRFRCSTLQLPTNAGVVARTLASEVNTNNDWGRDAGDWRSWLDCASGEVLRGMWVRSNDRIRRVAPVCSSMQVQSSASGASLDPDRVTAGRIDLGWVDGDRTLLFKVDRAGRSQVTDYEIRIDITTPPTLAPQVSAEPDSSSAIRWEWSAVDNDPDHYEFKLDFEAASQWASTGLIRQRLRSGLGSNICYRGEVRGRNEAGAGPIGSAIMASLPPMPNADDIASIQPLGGGGMELTFRASALPNYATGASFCEDNENQSRIWARGGVCGDGLRFTRQTAGGSGDRVLTFPSEEISGNGCFEFDIRYLNWFGIFRGAFESDEDRTFSIRRWVGGGPPNVTGLGVDDSTIAWNWDEVRGATEYQFGNVLDASTWTETSVPTNVEQGGLGENTCYPFYVRAFAPGALPQYSPSSPRVRAATMVRPAQGSDIASITQTQGAGIEVRMATGGIQGYGDASPENNCGSRTAIEVRARSCGDPVWASMNAPNGILISASTDRAIFPGLDEPGCYEFAVRYRNRAGQWNEEQRFTRWLGLDLNVRATTSRSDGVLVEWDPIPGLVYNVRRGGELIAVGLGGASHFDSEVQGPPPGSPRSVTTSTSGRTVFLDWQAPQASGSGGGDDPIYTVEGIADGSSVVTGTAQGGVVGAPIDRYEVRVNGGPWQLASDATTRRYEHQDVQGAILSISGGDASKGLFADRVQLGPGELNLNHSPPPPQFYQLRAISTQGQVGPASASVSQSISYSTNDDVFQWQREENGEWLDIAAQGIDAADTGAPASGDPRWYRLVRSNPNTDAIATTESHEGWRQGPPGDFTVAGTFVPGDPLAILWEWTASDGAETYAISRDGVGGGEFISTGSQRSASTGGLQANRCYIATVRASNSGGQTALSEAEYATAFPRAPRASDLDFFDSADGVLNLRFASAALPGFGDSRVCNEASNQTTATVRLRDCGGTLLGISADIDANREVTLPFGEFDCLLAEARFRNRFGFETEWGEIGEFRTAPTGTPTVFADFIPLQGFTRIGDETQGAHEIEVAWSSIAGAEGYNFRLLRAGTDGETSSVTPVIKTPDGDASFTVRNLNENTCYVAEAQGFNIAGAGGWGSARAATSIRTPLYRSTPGAHGASTCEPEESWELTNEGSGDAFRVRVFNMPPNFLADEGCAQEENLSSFRYQTRRCELFSGIDEGLVQSDWIQSRESPPIPTDGHHCYEVRLQYRNMDGVPSRWSTTADGPWVRWYVMDLTAPEDLVQVDAGYGSIVWGWSDASRSETVWHVRTQGRASGGHGFVLCDAWTRDRYGIHPEYPDAQYDCEEVGFNQAIGNVRAQRRVRAAILDPDAPNDPAIRHYGPNANTIGEGYTLVEPADICGTGVLECGEVTNWSNASVALLSAIDCDRVDGTWTNCSIRGAMRAPNDSGQDGSCGGGSTNSFVGMSGARLVRQRVALNSLGEYAPAGPEVVITENTCLDGSCPNGFLVAGRDMSQERGYGVRETTAGYWPGCAEGSWEDDGLLYGATYRYSLSYHNATGFENDATSWNVTIGCSFGPEPAQGVCAEGIQDTVEVGNDRTVVGNCHFPGRGDGTERCDPVDWSCSGDPYTNPGDDPENPTFTPGRSCGRCAGGQWVCVTDPEEEGYPGQICENADEGVNECDGCNTLAGAVGDSCDEPAGCGGNLVCDPLIDPVTSPDSTRLVCYQEDPAFNDCGVNCLPLDYDLGDSCGVCNEGAWTCDDAGDLFCANEDAGLNSCEICSPHEPGDSCTVPGELGLCAQGTWTCSGGSMSCVPLTNAQPELCSGQDEDCDGEIDNNARVVNVEIIEIFGGDRPIEGPCDITDGNDSLCTALRFRLRSEGTDVLPADTQVDLFYVDDSGNEVLLVEGSHLGIEMPGNGVERNFTLCWENATRISDVDLQVRLRDPEDSFPCLDPEESTSEPETTSLASCGEEICDGYDNNGSGIIDDPNIVCDGRVDLDCHPVPTRRCTSDADCFFNSVPGACNVHEGVCYLCFGTVLVDEDEDDCNVTGCPTGEFCHFGGTCVLGCNKDTDCALDEACVEGACMEAAAGPTPGSGAQGDAREDAPYGFAPDAHLDVEGMDFAADPDRTPGFQAHDDGDDEHGGCASAPAGPASAAWGLLLFALVLGARRRRER